MNSILVLSFVSAALYVDSKGGRVSWPIKALVGVLGCILAYDTFKAIQQTQISFRQPQQIAQGGIGELMLLEGTKAEPSRGILAISLPVAASAQRMPYGKTAFGELRVSAPAGNAGSVFIADSPAGCSTGPRYSIAVGDSEVLKVSEVSNLYYAGTAGDTLDIFSEVENG